jgi:hypothetical protein
VSVLIVPPLDDKPWPTLGPWVVQWMRDHLVYGPGDLRGSPYDLDDEKIGLVYRLYEIYPKEHPNAGRRRFRRAALSMRKGSAKSELGAAICAAELAPDGPVRFDGWRKVGRHWEPVGAPVTDPYIPMLAYTEEQSEELAFQALYVMLSEGPFSGDYDFGKERVMRRTGDGKAAALATAPDSRDGARTTMELFDETHRLTLPRQKEAFRTMLANLPKRRIADPWALEVTTAPSPGQGSVAENTMDYAKLVRDGAKANSRLFFFHRQATDGKHDLTTTEGVRAAVLEASGPVAGWSDIDGIVEQWDDPTADRAYLARVWLNMVVRSTESAFDMVRVKALADPDHVVLAKAGITLGLDGSLTGDWTALVATELSTGFQWVCGWWNPQDEPTKEIDKLKVSVAVDKAFKEYSVLRFYVDPPYWKDDLAAWQGKYGDKVVIPWYTFRNAQMAAACASMDTAIKSGVYSYDGDPMLLAHFGNCRKHELDDVDANSDRLWTVQKETPYSPFKIDIAVAAILSREARNDALGKSLKAEETESYLNAEEPMVLAF